ncbi:MAG: HAD family hydrolase [Candidatus Thorarchaeota archaeon]
MEEKNDDNTLTDKTEKNEEIIEEITEEITDVSESQEEIDRTPWVFFDYSGTLVDTVNALSKTYTKMIGKNFPPDKVKSFYKEYHSANKIKIFIKYRLNPLKFLFKGKQRFEEIRKEEFSNSVRAFPGVYDVLSRMKKMANVKMAIVTHEVELNEREEREKIFQKFGIPNVFDDVVTDYWNKKDSFDTFVEEKNIGYGIFVSDTQFDLNLGKNHNFDTIGVTWGFSSREELEANHIIDDPRELLQIIVGLLRKMEHQQLHGDPI